MLFSDGVVVLRVEDAWLVGVGKRAPHGWVPVPLFRLSSWLAGQYQKLMHYFLYIEY